MGRTREDALEAKKALKAAERRDENEAKREKYSQRWENAEADLRAKFVHFEDGAAYMTMGKLAAEFPALQHKRAQQIVEARVGAESITIGGVVFYPAPALRLLFDCGEISLGLMGKLEIFELRDREEFLAAGGWWDAHLLGLDPQRTIWDERGGSMADDSVGLCRLLAVARRRWRRQGRQRRTWRTYEDIPVQLRQFAWVAKGGNFASGPVRTIEEAMPFEVAVHHDWTTALYVRTLKREHSADQDAQDAAEAPEAENIEAEDSQGEATA